VGTQDMLEYVESVDQAVSFLKDQIEAVPETAIILGTGLSGLADVLDVTKEIAYTDIPGFPELTVKSHQGTLLVGKLAGVPVLALNGRAHLYEGYDARKVTFAVRVLGALGIQTLIVSNACGGMRAEHTSGDIMLIEDHINLMGANPLEGPNHDPWGPRFPDMSDPYTKSLRDLARTKAEEVGVSLHEGVYVAVVGPNLETRAEYRMLQRMGADVVGMSTVPEVLVARHMGMGVLAFSVITDECDPDNLAPIAIEDVLAAADSAGGAMRTLLSAILLAL
jgi:purine-nucleoside phosphorylase